MYKCKPERSARQAKLMLAVSFAVCFSVFLAASLIPSLRGILQLLGLLLLTGAIYVIVRFSLTEMEYTLTADDFSVRKVYGNRSQAVCCLDLTTAVCLIDRDEYLRSYKSRVNIKYNCCQNMKCNSWVYICEFNGKLAAVEFEPNPPFLAIAKGFVEDAIKRRDSGA